MWSERGGEAKALGERWRAGQKCVFELWHSFRGGGRSRSELNDRMIPLIEALGELPHADTTSRDAVLARACTALLDRYPPLWPFVSVEGVGRSCGVGVRSAAPAIPAASTSNASSPPWKPCDCRNATSWTS